MDDSIGSHINEEILTKEYECLICFNGIGPKSPIWSCRACFRVYDLQCIKKWGFKATESRGSWSCPHCMTPQSQKPQNLQYRCWCGKQRNVGSGFTNNKKNPKKESASLDQPHSCGQTCGAKRRCPHPCPLPCHAGPHADSSQCLYLGPKINCYCGRSTEQVICSMSKYSGFSCEGKCLRVNRVCGHKCQRSCHDRSGPENGCDPCEKMITMSCHCGEVLKTKIICSGLSRSQRNRLRGKNDLLISCGKVCAASLDCGKHFCSLKCHRLTDTTHACALKPREYETCFCGKTQIHRVTCEDPRTTCNKKCQKRMKCGHHCQSVCHPDDCPSCEEIVTDVPCRCRLTTQSIICKTKHELPRCQKKCDAILSCKRHKCRIQCCEFSNRRSNGKRSVARTRNLTIHDMLSGALNTILPDRTEPGFNEAEEAAHFCPRICERLLSCSRHKCDRPCHAGKCPPCLETSFEEYVCPCGSTTLEPPIQCGTSLPFCRARCHRPQPCGHPAGHLCHSNSDPCTECSVMVETTCRCGKSTVKEKCHSLSNQEEANASKKRCSIKCGEILACGHSCQEICCLGSGQCPPCRSPCANIYEDCGHRHQAPCHPSEPCPQTCKKVLVAQCPCGVTKCGYDCGEDLEIGCTETCLLESYPKILLDAYGHDKKWLLNIEYQIREFVKQTDLKTLWLKPMSKSHRRLTYYMLEHYGLVGESIDIGVNRSIRAYRTPETRLCKLVLQRAPKSQPHLYVDQIQGDVVTCQKDDATELESSENESMKSPDDGFVEVTSKLGSMIMHEDKNKPSAVTVPANQFTLLSN